MVRIMNRSDLKYLRECVKSAKVESLSNGNMTVKFQYKGPAGVMTRIALAALLENELNRLLKK